MMAIQLSPPVRLAPMPQLIEAKGLEDNWTGITDAAARRKRQTRLNVRAYRRRQKALQQEVPPPIEDSILKKSKSRGAVPFWVEKEQAVVHVSSPPKELLDLHKPLIHTEPTKNDKLPDSVVMFPLSTDHLIPLLQYNTLRGCLTNRQLLNTVNENIQLYSDATLNVLAMPSDQRTVPPTLLPTATQTKVGHEEWVDLIPCPKWRDNVLVALGTFDAEELWHDTIGGLFQGFPASDIKHRGVIAWNNPWHASGWELSEGFLQKWGWLLKGCDEVFEATNRWRRKRGEAPLKAHIFVLRAVEPVVYQYSRRGACPGDGRTFG